MIQTKALFFTMVLGILLLLVSADSSNAGSSYKVILKNGGVISASSYHKQGNVVYLYSSSGTIGMYKSDIKEIRTINDISDDSNTDRSADGEDASDLKSRAKATDMTNKFKSMTDENHKKGPIKIILSPEKKRTLQKQLYECKESLEKLIARGPRNYLTGEDVIRGGSVLVSKKHYKKDMTYFEAVWGNEVRQLEGKCNRIERRLEGYIVAEPRIDPPGR